MFSFADIGSYQFEYQRHYNLSNLKNDSTSWPEYNKFFWKLSSGSFEIVEQTFWDHFKWSQKLTVKTGNVTMQWFSEINCKLWSIPLVCRAMLVNFLNVDKMGPKWPQQDHRRLEPRSAPDPQRLYVFGTNCVNLARLADCQIIRGWLSSSHVSRIDEVAIMKLGVFLTSDVRLGQVSMHWCTHCEWVLWLSTRCEYLTRQWEEVDHVSRSTSL